MGEEITQVQYTQQEVVFLLGYYLEYRSNLISPTAVPEDPCIRSEYKVKNVWGHEMPLGHSHTDPPWPYMVKTNASQRVDGKRRAMKAQDFQVAMADLEQGLRCITDNYLEVIYKYYLFQTQTLEELSFDLGLGSKQAVQWRCRAAIKALTRHMNSGARIIST